MVRHCSNRCEARDELPVSQVAPMLARQILHVEVRSLLTSRPTIDTIKGIQCRFVCTRFIVGHRLLALAMCARTMAALLSLRAQICLRTQTRCTTTFTGLARINQTGKGSTRLPKREGVRWNSFGATNRLRSRNTARTAPPAKRCGSTRRARTPLLRARRFSMARNFADDERTINP
jgi:hypothetical protein